MSKLIAEIRSPEHKDQDPLVYVHASIAGVEVAADPQTTFTPSLARAYAMALVAGAEESERMLAKTQAEPEEHGYPEHTVGDIVGIARTAAEDVRRGGHPDDPISRAAGVSSERR